MRVDDLAKQYAETESLHNKRIVGMPFTDYEKDIASSAFKQGYLQAVRSAETMAVYSEKGIVERIRELRR